MINLILKKEMFWNENDFFSIVNRLAENNSISDIAIYRVDQVNIYTSYYGGSIDFFGKNYSKTIFV